MGKKNKKKGKLQPHQVSAEAYADMERAYEQFIRDLHSSRPQKLGPHSTILFEMQFDAMSAQSLASAVHYLDDTVNENDERATEVAHEYCLEVCRRVVDLFLPALAESGIQTTPEVWMQGYERVAAALGLDDEEGVDDDLEGP